MRKMCAVLILCCIPSLAFAAGFAKQSLFLSESDVTEGDTVLIYAVVTNETSTSFTGTLKFTDKGISIGSTPVSLHPGAAATASVSWKPLAGQHIVVADLVTADGQSVENENASFLIHPKKSATSSVASTQDATDTLANLSQSPPPDTGTIQSSQALQGWVANTAPFMANVTAPVFTAVDSVRSASAKKLSSGQAWAKDALAQAAVAPGGWLNTLWLIVITIVLYLCSTFSYVVEHIGVFYPLIALIFFYILWRIFRLVRGRRY